MARPEGSSGDVAPAPAPGGIDPTHWLHRRSAEGWLATALTELEQAEAAYRGRDAQAGLASAKRAAGMALNAALVVRPRDTWGRTYVEHLDGLAAEARVPALVREAAAVLVSAPVPQPGIVILRSRSGDERLLDAARTVMAHAYAVVHGKKTREET